MTKSETREVQKTIQYYAAGLGPDYLARALSALIRAARSAKSKTELMHHARELGITNHPEFII
jgi:hypothetical protein